MENKIQINFKNNFERQYAESLRNLLTNGKLSHNRTGIDTLRVDHQYFFIENCTTFFPRLRGKMVYPKLALKELVWMLLGRTDIKWLNDKRVNYWNEWVAKDGEFEGTIGKSYGYQYRNFNGIDQLEQLVRGIVKEPTGRRHIINLWNVSDLKDMMLPPCMYDFHFTLEEVPPHNDDSDCLEFYRINLHAHIRSNDSFLGCPYDVMFCAWFTYLMCDMIQYASNVKIDCTPGDIHYTADDYHLYVNHKDQAKQYLKNVDENYNKIIDSQSFIRDYTYYLDELRHLEEASNIDNPIKYSIDYYLEYISKNLNLLSIRSNVEDFYPVIKASVAV